MTYDPRLDRINQDLDEYDSLISKNIADITDNITKADHIERETEELIAKAKEFRKDTEKKRRKEICSKYKWYIIGGVALSILLVVGVVVAVVLLMLL